MTSEEQRCQRCGYTEEDKRIHGDHYVDRLCDKYVLSLAARGIVESAQKDEEIAALRAEVERLRTFPTDTMSEDELRTAMYRWRREERRILDLPEEAKVVDHIAAIEALTQRAEAAEAEVAEFKQVVREHHNGYSEGAKDLGWKTPNTEQDALRELISEGVALANHELRQQRDAARRELAALREAGEKALRMGQPSTWCFDPDNPDECQRDECSEQTGCPFAVEASKFRAALLRQQQQRPRIR